MLVCISNAGLQDDWTWKLREAVRVDPDWYFSRLDGPVASWITKEGLAEQERLLPRIAFRRLWLNEWTTGGGDALTEDSIEAAFLPGLRPQAQAESGYEYVGGLDLGVTRDASALCVLGVRRGRHGHGMIRLAYTRVWRPSKAQRVNLQDVEDAIRDMHARFDLQTLNYDPWEARHLASRLQAGGLSVQRSELGKRGATSRVPMVEVTSTPKNLQQIATVLIEAFNDRRLELYDDPDLRRDVTRFRVEERQYGFRLTSPRDEHGHGDLGTAFSLAMLAASELAGQRAMVAGVWCPGLPSPDDDAEDLTEYQRHIRRVAAKIERYAAEQESMNSKPTNSLADALREGRVHIRFHR